MTITLREIVCSGSEQRPVTEFMDMAWGICLLTERLLTSHGVFCCLESGMTRHKVRRIRSSAVGSSQVMEESVVVMELHGS